MSLSWSRIFVKLNIDLCIFYFVCILYHIVLKHSLCSSTIFCTVNEFFIDDNIFKNDDDIFQKRYYKYNVSMIGYELINLHRWKAKVQLF